MAGEVEVIKVIEGSGTWQQNGLVKLINLIRNRNYYRI